MSRMLSKMNLISVVQQLPKEDIETIQGYVEMIEEENQELKAELQLYKGSLKREHEAIHRVNDLEKVIDEAIKRLEKGIFIIPKDTNELLDILKGENNE